MTLTTTRRYLDDAVRCSDCTAAATCWGVGLSAVADTRALSATSAAAVVLPTAIIYTPTHAHTYTQPAYAATQCKHMEPRTASICSHTYTPQTDTLCKHMSTHTMLCTNNVNTHGHICTTCTLISACLRL